MAAWQVGALLALSDGGTVHLTRASVRCDDGSLLAGLIAKTRTEPIGDLEEGGVM